MALSGYGHADPVIPSLPPMSTPLLLWLKWSKSMFIDILVTLYYCSGQIFSKPPGGAILYGIFSPLEYR